MWIMLMSLLYYIELTMSHRITIQKEEQDKGRK